MYGKKKKVLFTTNMVYTRENKKTAISQDGKGKKTRGAQRGKGDVGELEEWWSIETSGNRQRELCLIQCQTLPCSK
jgi:hypothetical protein